MELESLPGGFCSPGSRLRLLVTGAWQPTQMASKTPQLQLSINRTTDLFHWEFKLGGKKSGNHQYEVWSRTNRVNNTKQTVNLTLLPRELSTAPTFNLSLSCASFPNLEVTILKE